jgi:hypothetical protein
VFGTFTVLTLQPARRGYDDPMPCFADVSPGRLTVAALITLGLAGAGCRILGPSAADLCAAEAPAYEGSVVGAFDTTVGAIRALELTQTEPARWPGLSDDHAAVLCYVDGVVAKSPPGGEPFDRAVIAVVDRSGELIAAGYRDRLPIRVP